MADQQNNTTQVARPSLNLPSVVALSDMNLNNPATLSVTAATVLSNAPTPVQMTSASSTPLDRMNRGIYYNLQSSSKFKISPQLQVEFSLDDLRDFGEIGSFGTDNKMVHRKTNTIMAVKRIRSSVDEKEQQQLLTNLDVVMRGNDCPGIVQFYGAIFKKGDC